VAIAVSTYYFPWNALKEANSLLELLTTMIQFPTRLTTIAAIAMTLVACTAGHWMLRWKDKVAKTVTTITEKVTGFLGSVSKFFAGLFNK